MRTRERIRFGASGDSLLSNLLFGASFCSETCPFCRETRAKRGDFRLHFNSLHFRHIPCFLSVAVVVFWASNASVSETLMQGNSAVFSRSLSSAFWESGESGGWLYCADSAKGCCYIFSGASIPRSVSAATSWRSTNSVKRSRNVLFSASCSDKMWCLW